MLENRYSANYYPPPTFGNDIWVGSNVVFIGSVHIGDGAVILTNAVVTKDVEPYSICGGVSAKPIGYRYNQEDIEFLIGIKWWNNSIDWFRKNWELINDINLLKDHIKQME